MAETEFDLILAYVAFWLCLVLFALGCFAEAGRLSKRTRRPE